MVNGERELTLDKPEEMKAADWTTEKGILDSDTQGGRKVHETTGEDIGRRSPKLPGWPFYEMVIVKATG